MSFAELKDEYLKMPDDEQQAFARFVADQDYAKWDEEIIADLKAGHLDHLIQAAKDDHAAGRTRELP